MFDQQGLSLEQAPPISVVLRFFLGGTVFGVLAGIALFFYGTDIFDPSTAGALTFTHLLTLGVMLSFMLGALFQMLPVIAGVVLDVPVQKANLVQYPLILGIVALLAAFNHPVPWLYTTASILLGSTLLYVVVMMLQALMRLSYHSASSKGMTAALVSLGLLTLLALYLTGSLAGHFEGSYYTDVKEAHYSFGLFGWVAMLIVAISFQVIEMFYVTPPYPLFVSRYLPIGVVAFLLLASIGAFFSPTAWILKDIILAIVLIGYAVLTLKRLSQRKRPLADATVWLWRTGMGALILSMLAMLAGLWIAQPWVKTLAYIFYAAFALSVVFAMFYKIVPFLTWFHLNSQGYFNAPMMHEVIHPKTAKKHLYIHLATIVAFVLALLVQQAIYIAASLLTLSFGWALWQVVHAHRLYQKTQKEGQRFDMGSMMSNG